MLFLSRLFGGIRGSGYDEGRGYFLSRLFGGILRKGLNVGNLIFLSRLFGGIQLRREFVVLW